MNCCFGYCYHSVNDISLILQHSDHIKQLPLYYINCCFGFCIHSDNFIFLKITTTAITISRFHYKTYPELSSTFPATWHPSEWPNRRSLSGSGTLPGSHPDPKRCRPRRSSTRNAARSDGWQIANRNWFFEEEK